MIENIFSSLILEWIGALVKWLIISPFNFFKGKKVKTVRFYYAGGGSKNGIDLFSTGVSNIVIGIISCVLFMLLIVKLMG
ncbi:hypothetical protein [Algoriphagus sp. CAU 1675]|uniref:hypothetical protein n=1 Tax=Algoriphagus sp. CAU 1675 TaxID=3032597 RepID=UPI0023D9F16C|nr:hypothetical protein [Algoriphagus sp. CAU 1675]MDF2158597.1 hypothetical protein [Algoriphagus sp. CAU 1675]